LNNCYPGCRRRGRDRPSWGDLRRVEAVAVTVRCRDGVGVRRSHQPSFRAGFRAVPPPACHLPRPARMRTPWISRETRHGPRASRNVFLNSERPTDPPNYLPILRAPVRHPAADVTEGSRPVEGVPPRAGPHPWPGVLPLLGVIRGRHQRARPPRGLAATPSLRGVPGVSGSPRGRSLQPVVLTASR
jgi:hypothetical protein